MKLDQRDNPYIGFDFIEGNNYWVMDGEVKN